MPAFLEPFVIIFLSYIQAGLPRYLRAIQVYKTILKVSKEAWWTYLRRNFIKLTSGLNHEAVPKAYIRRPFGAGSATVVGSYLP
jgi:hypothetical protein